MTTRSQILMTCSAAFAALLTGCSSPAPAPSSSSSDYGDCGYDVCGTDNGGGTSGSTGTNNGTNGGSTSNGGTSSGGTSGGGACGNACSSDADCASGSFCRITPGQSACVPNACNTCFSGGQVCSYYGNPCSFMQCEAPSSGSGGAGGSGGGAGAGGAGSGTSTTCHSMTGCVGATASHSNSTCNNELLATLSNNCGTDVYCRITTSTGDKSGDTLPAGATQSGEGAGYYWCDGSTSFTYQCVRSDDPATCLQ